MPESISDHPRSKPFLEFVEKVSIAGLLEAFVSHLWPVRLMFRITLVITFAVMSYETYAIIIRTMDQRSILSTLEIIDDHPPFPAVAICYPSTIHEKYWDEITIDTYENEKPVIDFMKKHHLSREDATKYLRTVMSGTAKLDDIHTTIHKLTKMVFDISAERLMRENKTDFSVMVLPCQSVLTNCSINGESFNCCHTAQAMFKLPFGTCYQIPPVNTSNGMNILSINVSMDWTNGFYENGVASDGFEIYLHTLPIMLKVPTFVPSGMDASVVMAEPRKINQSMDCIENEHEPKLKYYPYYDSEGMQCFQEAFLDMVLQFLGCSIAGGSYFPEHPNCTFEAIFSLFVVATMNFDAGKHARIKAAEEKGFGMMKALASHHSPCKPLCSRWSYPAISTSYTAVYGRNGHEPISNTSWSLIKIVMPYTSFMSEGEMESSRWSLAMRNVGAMMAVYAGFSVITLAEIAFYGLKLLFSRRRNRIAAAVGPTVSVACAIGQENAIV